MKFGICSDASKAAKLAPGTLDYVELNLTSVQKMTDDELKNTAKLLQESGTPAEVTNCFFPGTMRLCGKDYCRQTVAEYAKIALDHAAYLGIHACVLGSGAARNVDDGEDPSSCMRQFEEVVQLLGDTAKEYGTIILLEPLNSRETNMINTVQQGAEVCRRLSHPNVRLLADYFHVFYAQEPLSVLCEHADILSHIHISDPHKRSYPLAEEGFDYTPLKEALAAAGYHGRMSIEGKCPGDFVPCTTEAIAYLREIFQD